MSSKKNGDGLIKTAFALAGLSWVAGVVGYVVVVCAVIYTVIHFVVKFW